MLRGEGWEGGGRGGREKKKKKHRWVAFYMCPGWGPNHNPAMCPDWESSWHQTTEPPNRVFYTRGNGGMRRAEQSHPWNLALQIPFCSPQPLLLLLPDAMDSHRNDMGALRWLLSHSAQAFYRAEPRLRLPQEQIQSLCWALLSLEEKSSSTLCPAECAHHAGGHLGAPEVRNCWAPPGG